MQRDQCCSIFKILSCYVSCLLNLCEFNFKNTISFYDPEARIITNIFGICSARETIIRYAEAVNELIMDICRKIGEGLGLRDVPFASWPSQFRINKYPFAPENIGLDGLRAHTDNGFLTLVQDDDQFGGLEVMRKSGEFVAVEPCPGALLVNFGDIATVSQPFHSR